ncbi:MAG: glucosamine-6-phosphate deaminase [Clostridiales bacterium]|jgi:glucosamine-6-phosphate deaminase|nr:glucosamine-6-phosphate deaminase [Clostridiales bacterium]
MNILVCESYEKMSEAAAMILAARVMTKPDCAFGLPIGKTPLGLYEQIAYTHLEGLLDFKSVRVFNPGEFVGIAEDDWHSLRSFTERNLLSKLNVSPGNIHTPNANAPDLALECELFEEKIQSTGGIDLQILGIGADGHIGFNEPGDCFEPATHIARLTELQVRVHANYFGEEENMPDSVVTMGIGTILSAKSVIVLAAGARKAHAVREMVYGKVRPQLPASALQFHKDVTVITDDEAGREL